MADIAFFLYVTHVCMIKRRGIRSISVIFISDLGHVANAESLKEQRTLTYNKENSITGKQRKKPIKPFVYTDFLSLIFQSILSF